MLHIIYGSRNWPFFDIEFRICVIRLNSKKLCDSKICQMIAQMMKIVKMYQFIWSHKGVSETKHSIGSHCWN